MPRHRAALRRPGPAGLTVAATDPLDAGLRGRVEAWIADDPDPAAREELRDLLAARGRRRAARALRGHRLAFGTAGLRGPLGAGPTRMNSRRGQRVSAGLARHLLATVPGAAEAGVVLGHDARHGSARFADAAAAVIAGAGRARAGACPRPLPTPVLAFAVRHLGSAAGVMVTASHNPPQTTGTSSTCRRRRARSSPPADARDRGAHRRGRAAGAACRSRRPGEPADHPARGRVAEAYLAAIVAALPAVGRRAAELRVAYTPMHGVGGAVLLRLLARAGLRGAARGRRAGRARPGLPDGRLPQPGGAGRAGPGARRRGGGSAPTSLLANDPDADRLARGRARRGARRLAGADRRRGGRAARGQPARPHAPACRPARLVATTVVSSTLLSRDRGRGRRRLRRDADRLQVDHARRRRRAGRAPAVRLRGGARLRRRRRGARQGRHLRRAARRADGGGGAVRGAQPRRRRSTTSPRASACTRRRRPRSSCRAPTASPGCAPSWPRCGRRRPPRCSTVR